MIAQRMVQLALDGREVEHPVRARPLSDRQRDVVRLVRDRVHVRPRDVDGGYAMLRRLERRGLVVHTARACWRATSVREMWERV